MLYINAFDRLCGDITFTGVEDSTVAAFYHLNIHEEGLSFENVATSRGKTYANQEDDLWSFTLSGTSSIICASVSFIRRNIIFYASK